MKNIKRIFYICTLIVSCVSGLSAQVTATLTQPKGCENNGMIELQIEGEGPFTIDWTTVETIGGFSLQMVHVAHEEWNNQTKITDLPPGLYCVTVKNAKCCEAKQCFWLEKEGGSVKVDYIKNASTCNGGVKQSPDQDGEIHIAIPPNYKESDYDFTWVLKEAPNNVISNKKDLFNVQVIYTYVLTAYNKISGCEETLEVKLCCCGSALDAQGNPIELTGKALELYCASNNPIGTDPNINVTVKATPPTTIGASNGSIVLTVTGGGANPTYYYKWKETKSGKEFYTKDISGLPSGDYCYTVTNGCQTIKDCVPIYVCEEKPMKVTATLVKPCDELVTQYKGTYGSITIKVSGGATPYKYKWDNGKTTASISTLKSGTYCVTITDKGGCTTKQCFKLENGKSEVSTSTAYCKTVTTCDGNLVNTVLGLPDCHFDDPLDCAHQRCYCTLNGKVMSSTFFPFDKLDFDANCNLFGYCNFPNDFGSTKSLLEQGFKSQKDKFIQSGNCICGTCGTISVCTFFSASGEFEIPGSFTPSSSPPKNGPKKKASVGSQCSPDCEIDIFCGSSPFPAATLCTTCGNVSADFNVGFADWTTLTVGDLIVSLERDKKKEEKGNTRYVIPNEANLYTTLPEYNKIMEKMNEHPDAFVSGHSVDISEYKALPCENTCKAGTTISNKKANGTITEINIYPNPTDGLLNIEIPYKQYPKSSIKLINALGQVTYKKDCTEESSIKIDMSQLTNGTYNVLINDCNNATIFTKVIVKD